MGFKEYSDEKFKFEIKKQNDNTLLINCYFDTGGGQYGKNWMTLSPESIPRIIDVLNDTNGLEQFSIKEEFKNKLDDVGISIRGSDLNPVVTIVSEHKMENGEVDEGIIDIPFKYFGDRDWMYLYLDPFMKELQKYAI